MDRTRGIVRDLRRLTFALEPITLRDHGFSAAFGELAGQTADAHGIEVAVAASIVDDLERPVQVCLYRIAQEALANTVKHAGATRVSVRAHRRRDGSVEFAIADDGGGTSPEQLDRRGHHQGVDAMRERASGISATLRFEQTPGGGTTVRVVVPRATDALAAAA
jgi:signal transduction histidine kinase